MITEQLQIALEKANLSLGEFKELIIRLLNYGVLVRNENQIEQQLYDRFLRIAPLVNDYLSIIDIKLYHDSRFEFVRVYPPGSLLPGEDSDNSLNTNLRQRLAGHEVALILVLRAQYDKALREGQVDDHGYVLEPLEAISIAMKNLLGRNLPEKVTERKKLFHRLRRLRLIEYRQEMEFDNHDAWIKIHPMIVSFVTDAALQQLHSSDQPLPEQELDSDYVS
ncbi:MAG: DUF4194 domain-containing protein [Gammaproteobacteria bacterium]|nr:DUF4194 domain-containing protein [Gammaproteobacteria bacterium]